MIDDDPNEADLHRLLVGSWVALRAGTLDAEHRALLDQERLRWQAEAATLIAEGVLADVTVERPVWTSVRGDIASSGLIRKRGRKTAWSAPRRPCCQRPQTPTMSWLTPTWRPPCRR